MNPDQVRIGDTERERAAGLLADHFAAGRLSDDEHTERLDAVWSARTGADLAQLFHDLPGGAGPLTPQPPYPQHPPYPGRPTYWSGAPRYRGVPGPLVAVLVVIGVISILTHLPWVLIGLAVIAFVVLKHRRRQRLHARAPHGAYQGWHGGHPG